MSWSWTLYRYLAVQFFIGVAMVYAAFLVLAFSIDIVDLLNRTASHNVGTGVVVGMAIPALAGDCCFDCVRLLTEAEMGHVVRLGHFMSGRTSSGKPALPRRRRRVAR